MKILKFGGTSVGSPQRIKNLYEIIDAQSSDKKIVVLSAIAGTTNKLVAITEDLRNNKKQDAINQIKSLEKFYNNFIEELFNSNQTKEFALNKVNKNFASIVKIASIPLNLSLEKEILSVGELMSTFLFHLYLKEMGIDNVLLSALDFMTLNVDGERDLESIKNKINQSLGNHPNDKLFIVQGYICRNVTGEIDNLQRGGSDYSASLIGAATDAEEIQIWTDIDGFHNNDPRIVSNTQPIRFLNFDQAAELAYFGAKILHPQSVFPAQKYNIPVKLCYTLDPNAAGTLITNENSHPGEIVAVAAKDNITAIRIKSSRMLMTYGFLRKIFEIFEKYKTPIDMITTSEVAVSLTIDNNQHLFEIEQELSLYGLVTIDDKQSIICTVGDFSCNTHGHVSIVSDAVKHLPIRMISYGGSNNNISLVIAEKYKSEAIKALQNRLFNIEAS